ncbi:MAG TPA: VOC family protein [Longimicrobiaceae bacterium]|nr:VOC family protein [Longimicrobiaceae bacterium]
MERVTGIGGVFFKSADPARLNEWYGRALGIETHGSSGAFFQWRATEEDGGAEGMTVWNAFPASSPYFDPTTAPFMINYRVANLDRMLAQLREAGAQIDDKVEDTEYGRFAWAVDPDGTRFELWEPPAETQP